MTSLDRTATVAQIVAQHAATARIFQAHQIDFCCHGEVSVPEACRGRELDPDALFAELEAAVPATHVDPEDDARSLATPALIARIVSRHHAYLRDALPAIHPLLSKVARVHGAHNQKLDDLQATFVELAEALEPHIDEEEAVLFPALMARIPDQAVIRRELARMHEDHLAVGQLLARMRTLSDGFATPEWGCNSYRAVMSELETLEGDVLRHVHLENHVLMPRFAATARAS